MGRAQISQIPVPTSPPAQAWTGTPNSTDQVLYWNQDVNNVVYLAFLPNFQANGPNTIPVPPNGSFSLPADRSVWVVGSVQGIQPLVVIPNAGAMFRSLTQGLGSLAIPSVFSPNFVHGVSGWSINKDGSAEFNNVIVRGNEIFANGFLSNGDGTLTTTPGLFIYSAAPAAGNLIFAATGVLNGHDKFNNNYLPGSTWFDNSTLVAINSIAGGNGEFSWYTFTANPNAVFTQQNYFQYRQAPPVGLAAIGVGTNPSLILGNFSNGAFNVLSVDGSGYVHSNPGGTLSEDILGERTERVTGTINVPSTTPVTILATNVVAGTNYKIKIKAVYVGGAAVAGHPVASWTGSATVSNVLGEASWDASGGGQGKQSCTVYNANAAPAAAAGIALVANGTFEFEAELQLQFSVAGTFVLQMANSAAASSFAVAVNSSMYVRATN